LNYSGGTAEGFTADDELGFLYATEEAKGIHKFYADPDQSSDRRLFFASGDGTVSDREGVGIYGCSDGTGYLVLSSQGNSTIKIYERQEDNKFMKTVIATNQSGKTGLGSDGLDVTSGAVPPLFPNGFVVVHDDPGSVYHVYDWRDFAESELTSCDGSVPPPPTTDTTPPAPPVNVRASVE